MLIRAMGLDDLRIALDWARAEGWSPGLDDAAAFHAADPEGFLMGEIDGVPVAAISVVRHAPTVGFLGLYIVAPAHRGRGFGLALWNAGMARLEGASVGLDGVVAQQANYRRSGFALSHRNRRFLGRIAPADDAGAAPLGPAHLDAVGALDRAVVGYDRPAFRDAWLRGAKGRSAMVLLRGRRLDGYGVIRDCGDCWKIGPLFAPDAAGAEALVRGLASHAGGPIAIDAPEPNAAANALVARLGMREVFETARMWRGDPPSEDVSRIFGVTTFELG